MWKSIISDLLEWKSLKTKPVAVQNFPINHCQQPELPIKASEEGDIQIFSAKTENRTNWVEMLPSRSKT